MIMQKDNFKLSPKYLEELNKAANEKLLLNILRDSDHSTQLFTGRDETPIKSLSELFRL